jgi:predicted small metal-binding protein
MKTVTCKQMGGPCDAKIQGNTPEEVMQKGGEHVNEMAAKGDEGHIKAKEMMDAAGNNPEDLKKWQDQFMATYNAAPQE